MRWQRETLAVVDEATSSGADEMWWDISTGAQCWGVVQDGRHESVRQWRIPLLRCFVAIAVLEGSVGTDSRLTWTASARKRYMARNRDRSPPVFCIFWAPSAIDRKRSAASASASAKMDIRRRSKGNVMVDGHSCSSLEHVFPYFPGPFCIKQQFQGASIFFSFLWTRPFARKCTLCHVCTSHHFFFLPSLLKLEALGCVHIQLQIAM